MEKVFKIFKSQPYLAGHLAGTENTDGGQFWLLITLPILNNHHVAKHDTSISSNSSMMS